MRRREAGVAFGLSEMYPEHRDEYLSIAGGLAIGQRELLTKDEIQEADDPSFWEGLGTSLEPFLTLQRGAWYLGYTMGEYLPDPGTAAGDLMQDVVGTIGGAALATGAGIVEAVPLFLDALGVWGDDDDKTSGGPSQARGPAEELLLGFSDMVESFYGDVATGEMKRKAEEHMRPWLWWDWSMMPAPTGEQVVDSLISYQAAEHLAQHGETAVHRKFGDWMSSDMGRLAFGIGMELVLDPLWFAGPGKAGSVVKHAGKAYQITRPMMRAAGKMELLDVTRSAQYFREVLLASLVGSGKTADDASRIVKTYGEMATMSAELSKTNLKKVQAALKANDQKALKALVRELGAEQVHAAKAIAAKATTVSEKLGQRA
jgi:hypothetical protein